MAGLIAPTGRQMSTLPIQTKPGQEQPGVVLPSGRQAPAHQQQKPNIKRSHVAAPSDASGLKEFSAEVSSHLYLRGAPKFGIVVNANELWDWFAYDKKWSTIHDVYAEYGNWEMSLAPGNMGCIYDVDGVCAIVNAQLWRLARLLCVLKAADEYMGEHASTTGNPTLFGMVPGFEDSFLATMKAGKLDLVAQAMRQRLGVAKAPTLGINAVEGVILIWLAKEKKWTSYHDMFLEYGTAYGPAFPSWQAGGFQAFVGWAKLRMKDGMEAANQGNIQALMDAIAADWYNLLIYPLCIEVCVDQFMAWASVFKK